MEGGSSLSLRVSKVFGYGMVVGSSLFKVPQIVRIIKSKSAQGLR